MSLSDSICIGSLVLPNRIAIAPLGRARSEEPSREPLPRVVAYYTRRATNPDLVERFRAEGGYNPPDTATFCVRGEAGHIDHPFLDEQGAPSP